MRYLLVLILLLVAPLALAEERFMRQGNDEVRIFDGPCIQAETLARIPKEQRDEFHKATGKIGGQIYFGCWREAGEAVFLIWEDGDQGLVPVGDLKPATDA